MGFLPKPSFANFRFAKWQIDAKEIFYESGHSVGFVNFKPLTQGHVLVAPKRVVPLMTDLTTEELADLVRAAHDIGERVKAVYNLPAWQMSVQDGPEAGQTVAHVHIHVIPQNEDTFRKDIVPDDADRVARSLDIMAAEARQIAEFSQ